MTMTKTKTLKPLWAKLIITHALIGLVLIALVLILFRGTLYRDIRDMSISNDASLPIIDAEVTGIGQGLHWHVYFRWEDENGIVHTGQSVSDMRHSTATRIQRWGSIEIRERDGRGIPVTYHTNQHGLSFWLTLVIGGLVWLAGWWYFTYFYNDLTKMGYIQKHGNDGIGSISSLTDYKGTQTHKALVMRYQDSNGTNYEAKNPFPLNLEQGRALEGLKEFGIKYIGGHAYVNTEPLNEWIENNPQTVVSGLEQIMTMAAGGGEVHITKSNDGTIVKKVVTLAIDDEEEDEDKEPPQLVEARCPNCKGIVELSEDSKRGRCLYCDTPFVVR